MSDEKTERGFPDMEIETSISSFGGWLEWLGNGSGHGVAALRWKASQGDEIPDDLVELRDALEQFGIRPMEATARGAIQRVRGLERAFAEIKEIMRGGLSNDPGNAQKVRDIVETCVKFSGDYREALPSVGEIISGGLRRRPAGTLAELGPEKEPDSVH